MEHLFVPDTLNPGQPGSSCTFPEPNLLAPGESCTYIVTYYADDASAFAGIQTGALVVAARDVHGTVIDSRIIQMSGKGA